MYHTGTSFIKGQAAGKLTSCEDNFYMAGFAI